MDNRTGKRASAATAAAGRERPQREPDGIVMISGRWTAAGREEEEEEEGGRQGGSCPERVGW